VDHRPVRLLAGFCILARMRESISGRKFPTNSMHARYTQIEKLLSDDAHNGCVANSRG
jgi:hypothetical protein